MQNSVESCVIHAENMEKGVAEDMEKLAHALKTSKGFVLFGLIRNEDETRVAALLGGAITKEMTIQFGGEALRLGNILHGKFKGERHEEN